MPPGETAWTAPPRRPSRDRGPRRGRRRRRPAPGLRVRHARLLQGHAGPRRAPAVDRGGAGRGAPLPGGGRPHHPARLGHGAHRRGDGAGGRRDDRRQPDGPHPRGGPPEPLRGGGAGRDQPRPDPRRGGRRLLLRPGPLEPDGLLDRRERGHQRRRAARPQVRERGASRPRSRGGHRHRRGAHARRRRSRSGPDTTSRESRWAPRAPSASSPRSW